MATLSKDELEELTEKIKYETMAGCLGWFSMELDDVQREGKKLEDLKSEIEELETKACESVVSILSLEIGNLLKLMKRT